MTQIVGINGFKRSGKGEVANFLSADPNAGVVYQIGFADKVKILGARALGFVGNPRDLIALMDEAKLDNLDGGWEITVVKSLTGERSSLTGRRYLQNVGTEARKVLGDSLWVDQVLPEPGLTSRGTQQALAHMYPEVDIVAITDLRFENEAERVRECGGVIWEVIRPGTSSDGHASELVLPRHLVDYQIDNAGSLDDLRHEVESAMEATL